MGGDVAAGCTMASKALELPVSVQSKKTPQNMMGKKIRGENYYQGKIKRNGIIHLNLLFFCFKCQRKIKIRDKAQGERLWNTPTFPTSRT